MKKILFVLLLCSISTCYAGETYIHADFVRLDLVQQAQQSPQVDKMPVYTQYDAMTPQQKIEQTQYPLPSMDDEPQNNFEQPTAFDSTETEEDELLAPESEVEASNENNVNQPDFDMKKYSKIYKGVTKDGIVMQALELMKGTIGEFSYNAIMGNNLTKKKIKIQFRNLAEIKQEYESFDALGWKSKGVLNIYINEKHKDAPPEAIAALLSHEAVHQDEFASLNEETYAWTLEAGVWMQLSENNDFLDASASPLVDRENMLKKLFVKGNYTNKYIKKAVWTNPGYTNLPTRSPGFEDEDL